ERGVEGQDEMVRATRRGLGQGHETRTHPVGRPRCKVLPTIRSATADQEVGQRDPFAEEGLQRLTPADSVDILLRRHPPGDRVYELARRLDFRERTKLG